MLLVSVIYTLVSIDLQLSKEKVMGNKQFEAEAIWADIENTDVNVFGFGGKLSSYITKVAALADGGLYLKAKAPAVIIELERICECDSFGKRLDTPKYILTQAEEGYIVLRKPDTTVGLPGKDGKTTPEVIGSVVLMSPPEDKK